MAPTIPGLPSALAQLWLPRSRDEVNVPKSSALETLRKLAHQVARAVFPKEQAKEAYK